MKGHYLLHVLLVTVLCWGQIASQVHVAGHNTLDQHSDDSHAGHAHHAIPHHLAHRGHYRGHWQHPVELVSNGHKTDENDCSAYHTYAGLNGLALSQCITLATQFHPDLVGTASTLSIPTSSTDNKPIRGPPQLS